MKQRKVFLCALALAAVCYFPCAKNVQTAYAQENTYTVEYAAGGITLPLLHMGEGESYQVEVFKGTDTGYTTPLTMLNAYTFIADEMGEYLLRYLVNRNGVESYEYATLIVQDTTAPTFSLQLKETYTVGETLSLMPQIKDNTASMATVSYQLICNGKVMTSSIQNNAITFSQTGTYKLQVTVTDGGGNVAKETYSFTVAKGSGTQQTPPENTSCMGMVAEGTVVSLMIATGALLAKKRKEEK